MSCWLVPLWLIGLLADLESYHYRVYRLQSLSSSQTLKINQNNSLKFNYATYVLCERLKSNGCNVVICFCNEFALLAHFKLNVRGWTLLATVHWVCVCVLALWWCVMASCQLWLRFLSVMSLTLCFEVESCKARQGSVYFSIAFNITPISLMNLSRWLKSHYHWEYLDTWSLVQDEPHAVELDLMFPLNSIPVSTPRYDSCLESSRWLN